MIVRETNFPGLLVIEPRIYEDLRGWFMETYQSARLATAGIVETFVQDNHSLSRSSVLRGLHYQIKHPQGKLVRVVRGEIYDVAVDLRRPSPTFGKWFGMQIGARDHKQLYIPPGFAHGFLVLSDQAEIVYKCTELYHPEHERTLFWNDPQLGIEWPIDGMPLLSEKDEQGSRFDTAAIYESMPGKELRTEPTIKPPHFSLTGVGSSRPITMP
jgi:dTDP-4-dehydrorhamnose 3,5-epimerase